MSEKWEQGICNERSGFLFNHWCVRNAAVTCSKCAKPVCDHHFKEVEGLPLCIGCLKKKRSSKPRDSRPNEYEYDDDPYFYGGYHYEGYGDYSAGYWGAAAYMALSRDDANDFTEADAESLVDETAEEFDMDESFESDTSES